MVLISSYTTIITYLMITTTDTPGLEFIGSLSITSFFSLRVEIVIPSFRKGVVVTWIIVESLINLRLISI